MSKKPPSSRSRFWEETSFLRTYLWKYRKFVGIGLGALVVVDILDVFPPILLKKVVDVATSHGADHAPLKTLYQLALAYFGIALVQGGCRYLWRMYLVRASLFAGRDLREKYSRHLFNLSVSFFDQHPMGELMSLATNDVEAVRLAMGSGLLVFADAVFYILTIPVAMWFLSPQLTLLACLPLPLIPWVVIRNEKKVHERLEKVQECFGRISAMTQENLNGVRVVKGFAQEDVQYRRLRELGEEYMRLSLGVARVQSTTGPIMDFVMSLGMIALLFWGGGQLIDHGETLITLGTFVAFQRYIQKMIWPMAALGMAANYFQKSLSSTKRLEKVFASQSDVLELSEPKRPSFRGGKTQGGIEFKNLHFCFPRSDQRVLKGIDLTIQPGERVALVGSIASGKSTVLSLLPRLYPVESGMVFVDGVDINHWPLDELRKQVGYVSQEVYLFSESVFENVAFGLQHWIEKGYSTEGYSNLIEESARLASVHEEIQGLELAYKTRLGERGVNLSGGQKQRLTIARALAKEPSILVLDDALAAVDLQTEENILQSLRSRKNRNTEIVAAHRISTVKDSDRIVVLHEGEIVQMGNHLQLSSQRNGIYWKFYEKQKMREELETYQDELSRCY
jgi:ATP-binding cassette subfamily B protein